MKPETTQGVGRLLITGASGYIGARLARAARTKGLEVVAGVRHPDRMRSTADVEVRAFDLTSLGDHGELLAGVDSVVHLGAILAEDSLPAGVDEDLNVAGTRRLLDAARARGVRRFVFLSSQSAAPDSPTKYGRAKWQIEQMLTAPGESAVRTGLVSGGAPRGLYGTLFRLTKKLPVLPVVHPGAPVYPVHVDDLCDGLLSLVLDHRDPPRLARIAPAESTTFGAYIRMLARNRLGRRVRLVPVPGRPIAWLSRLTERVPFLPTVNAERVEGLMALQPMDPESIPAPPAAPPLREVPDALAHEGFRRRLAAEGRTLARYVVGRPVPGGVQRRYVRAVLAEEDRAPLDLQAVIHAWPALLRVAEPIGDGSRLRKRLRLATRLVEFTTGAAPIFHNYVDRPRPLAWLALAWIVVLEALLLPLRLLASVFRRPGRR